MAQPVSWISHVEAFVDVSRPASVQVASVEAIAALVKQDVLTLEALVRELELYLTTSDNVIRARGILLLAEILTLIIPKPLDCATIRSLAGFFTSRMADWQALRGALIGCLALLRRSKKVGMVSNSDARMLAESYLKNVQAQSLAVHDRKLCFEVLQCLLGIYPDSVKTLGDDLVYGICDAIDGEKDPRCLMLTFHLVETLVQLFPDPSGSVANFAEDLFEILGCYFPINYTHSRDDDFEVKRGDLSRALMCAFGSTPYFEPFAVPLLLEKLSSSLPLAKLDSLKYLNNCLLLYGADRMTEHAKPIWNALKDVIFNSSPGRLVSSTIDSGDMESQDTEIGREALLCLQRTISVLNSPSNDIFLGLIIGDEDMDATFRFVTDERNNVLMSQESQCRLSALGSVLSNSLKVSTDSCNIVFLKYFPHLMDILGITKCNSSKGFTKNGRKYSERMNFGALYLCVELLASCRDLVLGLLATQDLSSQFLTVRDSWWCLLKDYSSTFTNVLKSILETHDSCVAITEDTGIEDVYFRVKGLQVLLTFPGCSSPISDNVYEDILALLMSVITDRSGNTGLLKLSLRALTKIGSFIEEFHDSKKKLSYKRIVVERIVSLLPLNDSTISLSLKLDMISEIGVIGLEFMLTVIQGLEEAIFAKLSEALVEENFESAETLLSLVRCYSNKVLPWCQKYEKYDEIAVHFVITIWEQLEAVTAIKIGYGKQDLLEAIMMLVKLATGGCTEKSQSLILQKAYNVFSSSFTSVPLHQKLEGLEFASKSASLSSKDKWVMYLFAAVLIGLHPQTYIPNLKMLIKLFAVFVLKGHIPAAQALASIINKWPAETQTTEMPSAYTLEEAIKVLLEMGLSNARCSSHFGNSTFVNNDKNFTSIDDDCYQIHAVIGMAWIGKGLLMRGHEKVKDIALLFLNCILSGRDMKLTSSLHDDSGNVNEKDEYSLVARSAADAFHILLCDSEECLNRKFHATIKPLYKQRFFSSMMPILLSAIKESDLSTTRDMLDRAYGHIISDTPVAAVIVEAKQVIPSLLNSLSALSPDISNKDMIYNLLLVLSGMLMDENGKEIVLENVHTIINHLIQLISYLHLMIVRETAIQCLVAISCLPHAKIYPMRRQVLRAVSKALDDHKRVVRQEAVRCLQAWGSIASRSLNF